MKTLVCVSLSLAFLLSLLTAFPEEQEGRDVLAEKSRPYEHFYQQRSLPEEPLDVREFTRVVDLAKENLAPARGLEEPWTQEGPFNIGGRLNCVAVHPENENRIIVGASTGGMFVTNDGGLSWIPMGEDMAHLPIGCISIDPINPDVIYTGTGDPNISGLPHPGGGIYKSEDGGASWTNIGLDAASIITKIHVAPTNPNLIYATAMGLPFAPSVHKGVYRSMDAGLTWEKVHYVDDETGACDMVVDPENPNKLYVAFWRRVRNNQESIISGESCRIWRSQDGGENWEMLEEGLPGGELCRIGLAMSGSDSDRVYAVIISTEFQLEGIYRTSNGGDNWSPINWDMDQMAFMMGGFGWYFAKIRVNPLDDGEISVLGVDMYTTENSGNDWFMSTPPWWQYEVHADKHDMLYLPSGDILLATDGGLYKSDSNFENWVDLDVIPNTQFYHVGLDPFNPDNYTGGAQDNGTTTGNESLSNEWTRDYGGDGFQAYFDPENDDLRYAATQNGGLTFFDGFFWDSFTSGISDDDRRNWDMPYIMSSFDNETFYTGTYRIYAHYGAPYGSWFPLSDDLTDGVIYGDRYHTISTVAESPVDQAVLYAGTTDANVWRSLDYGDSWEQVNEGLPERYVTNIKASPETASTVFVSHSGYKDNDQTSYIHRSDDHGDNWISIAGDLPDLPVNHLEVWNDSTLVIATDVGVYFTENGGANWGRVGSNMPIIPVFDLEFNPAGGTLVAATYARSMMTYPLDSLITEPEIVESVGELSSRDLNIYPNPVRDELFVEGLKNPCDLVVRDMSGKRCLEGRIIPGGSLDVSSLRSGYYLLSTTEGQARFLKLD